MFGKVLIANRGEIAVRVMATCAEMGITTVAVYSEADAGVLHVRRADESYPIGPAPAASSYLDGEAILRVAAACGAEAIHPGYGFLSENAHFAGACRRWGIVFVGPSPEAMRLLGDKAMARGLARRVGVPVLEGYEGDDQSPAKLAGEAQRIGYPLMIKAVAGGGGKGMRLVPSGEAFVEALEGARREARSSFGDDRVLLERLLVAPRHVEFQVLADAHGAVIHLGERECSVQRRHQKVIEESPSTALSPALRAEMGAAAVAVMRAAGYVNTGTVEFLLAPDGAYYFLEVNTRLQVEHPVTEAVTGLDLVREQLRIAAGAPLALRQDDVVLRGHALECRVYAEDAVSGFLPATGTMVVARPPVAPGVRNDVGLETGDAVTPYYDPLLAKLIVHAPDRAACVQRAVCALRHYDLLGVTTNLRLIGRVLEAEDFCSGALSTAFLDEHLAEFSAPTGLPDEVLIAAAGWARTASEAGPGGESSPWRAARGEQRASREARYRWTGGEARVVSRRLPLGTWEIEVGSSSVRSVQLHRAGAADLVVREGAQVWTACVVETPTLVYVSLRGAAYALRKERGLSVDDVELDAGAIGRGGGALTAPMPGTVVKVMAAEGDRVEAGQPLLVLEAMKMEHAVAAPYPGTVRRLFYGVGDMVAAGAVLAEVQG